MLNLINKFRRKKIINIDILISMLKQEMEKTNWYINEVIKWTQENYDRNSSIKNNIKNIKISGKYNYLYENYIEVKIKEMGYNVLVDEYMGAFIYNINNTNYITDGKYSALELAYYDLIQRKNK